ncbi:TetR/AcrR family transcriptional regulator [Mycobacterium sp. AZCC_0083]|uniref:TetR/AcrR family transcriptional regulator n=1 Tax=Mycobacterium sp. AZCC_0083 TaxID=2735882 RepID=UPI001614B1B2|nr:TetR/AcrR family transcriptional regulator [Mycobacterium sp. AZCC_0083]MBB5164712.1 AcrR family transcriptional regulator [Mycobacterium sp. AZCC_0083]
MATVNPTRLRTPRAEVRQRILQAATSEFAGKGFAGTTIDAIADAAGFTKGAVYSNFGSKDDLFFALLDLQIECRVEAVSALADKAGARPSAKDVGDLLMTGLLENRDWQMLFAEYWLRAMRDPEVRVRFTEHRRSMRASIEDAVGRLDTSGIDPATATVLILALNNGLSIEEFSDPGSVPHDLFGTVLAAIERNAE